MMPECEKTTGNEADFPARINAVMLYESIASIVICRV